MDTIRYLPVCADMECTSGMQDVIKYSTSEGVTLRRFVRSWTSAYGCHSIPLLSSPEWNLYRCFLEFFSLPACFTRHDSAIAPFPSFALNDEVKLGRTLGVFLSFSWFEIILKFDWFVGCLYMTIIFSFDEIECLREKDWDEIILINIAR